MNRYRIYWGHAGYQSDIVEAETAEDAKTIFMANSWVKEIVAMRAIEKGHADGK